MKTYALISAGLLGFPLFFHAGCGGPQYVENTAIPATGVARPGEPVTFVRPVEAPVGVDPRLNDPPEVYLERFAQALSHRRSGSVGCLPFVGYDLRKKDPSVSQLGVTLADDIARSLSEKGFKGTVYSTQDMAALLTEMNVDRAALSSIPAIVEHGEKLGTEVVVFGTIQEEHDVGRSGRDLLTVDVVAYDVLSAGVAVREKFEIPSDRAENARYWGPARRESPWRPGNGYSIPDAGKTLDREIHAATRILGNRVLRALEAAKVEGIVYVPPADTSRFVQAVARVRSAQAAFAAEFSRRIEEAEKSGKPLDIARPLKLNDVEFADLQAAHAYLEVLREGLMASEAYLFGQQVSSMLAERIIPRLAPREVKVNEVGFTKWSDNQLVEGELATGGLARSLVARNAMKAAGIELVAALRFERFGNNFLLRLEVYDLKQGSVSITTHFPISAAFERELGVELGVTRVEAIRDLPEAERGSWDAVYPTVASGVVRFSGTSGLSATGFLVSRDGLVMTNSHVIQEIAAWSPHVMFHDGTTAQFTVVMNDPFWDVAVVKVHGAPAGAHVFEFASMAEARVGREVAVLGHPRDTQGWAFSPGHLSSIREKVPTHLHRERPSYMYTCATRPGASGSPVLLLNGKVVAVNSHSLTGVSFSRVDRTELTGFAFGVPGVEAQRLLGSLTGSPQ